MLENKVLITIVEASVQRLPLLGYFSADILNLVVGKSYGTETFGYNRNSVAESAGDFAVRGSIIDTINYNKLDIE
ncbi:MAG: hypothetical protein MTP17_00480 [Candidatus Midichloria sp.]|nr:MAG: hypothetical protein MTP17_00480 [Candidatus Midichloria sp.]